MLSTLVLLKTLPRQNHLQLTPRYLNTTCPCFKKKAKSRFMKKFYTDEEAQLRPSDLEIKKKDLPENTPTLGQRIRRDGYHMFHQSDSKHGYHSIEGSEERGPTTFYKEVLETVKKDLKANPKETFATNFNIVKGEFVKFGKELKKGYSWSETIDRIPRNGDRRTEGEFKKVLICTIYFFRVYRSRVLK